MPVKAPQITSLFQALGPILAGFEQKGAMLFQLVDSTLLKGFYFDESSHSGSHFYVWAFVLPLYIPRSTISLNFGKRLGEGSGTRWNLEDIDMPSVLSKEMLTAKADWLDRINNPTALANYLSRGSSLQNLNDLEALAYTYILSDDQSSADATIKVLTELVDPEIDWHRAILNRVRTVQQSGLKRKELLLEWSQESIKHLSL